MIQFDVTETDQRAWMQFAIDEQGRVGALRVAGGLLVTVIGAIVGHSMGDFTGLGIGAGVGAVLALTLVPATVKRSVARQINEAVASAPDGSVGPVTLELTERELTYTTSATRSSWQRRAVRRVVVRGEHAFIMFGPSNGLVVPIDGDPARRAWIQALNGGRVPD